MTGVNQNMLERFNQNIKRIAGDLLSPQRVDFQGGGTASIRLSVTGRRANESDMTPGASTDVNYIAIIDAEDWDTHKDREPGKGDVIHWDRKRYAVDRCATASPGGVRMVYRAFLQG